MLGGVFGLISAVSFAFNNAIVRRGVINGTAIQATAISLPIGVVVFFLVTFAAGELPRLMQFSSRALLFLATAGAIHFVWGRYCNYRATKAMGANLVGPVQQTSLLLTLALAIWLLGETLTVLKVIGMVLVVLGPALMLSGGGSARSPRSAGAAAVEDRTIVSPAVSRFEPDYAAGYLWALLSGLGYGVSPVLIKLALESRGLGASLAGGLVAYIAATVVVGFVVAWPGQMRHILDTRKDTAGWFAFSGVLICLSQMFLYMGYTIAPISVVAPIQRLSIVFRVHAGWLINRHHEEFGGRVLLATAVSLFGAVALSLSSDLVLAYVQAPEALRNLAAWHWP